METNTSIYDLLDLQIYPMIADNILANLGPHEVIKLSRTCKRLSSLYDALKRTHWNMDRRLGRWVEDPVGLRAALGKHDALIAGGFVTQYFDRQLWPSSDLDIFAEDGDNVNAIRKYLIETEHYKDVGGHHGQAYEHDIREFLGVRNLEKKMGNGETRRIQCVSMKQDPLVGILRDFYGNVVANFMTSTKAYCIFPRSTFIERKAYYLKYPTEYVQGVMKKYEARGFQLQQPDEDTSSIPRHGDFAIQRRVGDSNSWTLAFEHSTIPAPNTPDMVRDYGCFGMTCYEPYVVPQHHHGWPGSYYLTDVYELFKALPLRYKYVCADQENAPNFWLHFVGPCLDMLTFERFRVMPSGARPEIDIEDEEKETLYTNFQQYCTGWQYIDEKVPRLFEEFEKMKIEHPTTDEWETFQFSGDDELWARIHERIGLPRPNEEPPTP